MDQHTKKQRSFNMSMIRGKDTKPELILRKWLWANGYRYRLHSKNLPGKPDIVFPGRRKVIFVNGCFWHKHDCRHFKWPQTNVDFWLDKISANVSRDHRNKIMLEEMGWQILTIWECELKHGIGQDMPDRIKQFLD